MRATLSQEKNLKFSNKSENLENAKLLIES